MNRMVITSVAFNRLVLAVVVLVIGCAAQPKWSRYELYFGLSADQGRTRIPDQQWQQFQEEQILTRFADGFTVFSAAGYWRSDDKSYAEPSRVLVVVAPDTADTETELDTIARTYARRFGQQAVLKVKSPARIEFVSAYGTR